MSELGHIVGDRSSLANRATRLACPADHSAAGQHSRLDFWTTSQKPVGTRVAKRMEPFGIVQITRVTKASAIGGTAVFRFPHRALPSKIKRLVRNHI